MRISDWSSDVCSSDLWQRCKVGSNWHCNAATFKPARMLQSSAARYSDCVAPGRAKPRLGSLPSTGAACRSAGFQQNCAADGVAKQALAIAARDKFRATPLMFIIVLLVLLVIIPLLLSP